MVALEIIYDNFGPIWVAIFAILGAKGFLRVKRAVKIPTLILFFILFCIPRFSAFLYLFTILEMSVLSTNVIKRIARTDQGKA